MTIAFIPFPPSSLYRGHHLMTAAITLPVRALLLGERLETRGLEREDTIATAPLTLRLGDDRIAVLFRYGVAVFVGLSPIEEDGIVRSLAHRIGEPLKAPESETTEIVIRLGGEDQVDPSGGIALKDASPERLQIVASVLSKSLMLSYYEAKIAGAFDRIEPLAAGLQRKGRTGSQARDLLRQIGDVLLTQHRMVGRVEIEEKPEMLWDHPELERLYARLEDEYELVERSHAMERKLTLINETAGMLIDLVQNQRSTRLEWYIIGLIGIEILLSVYQLVGGGVR
jgi:required for meiotic nuclear division protein 1